MRQNTETNAYVVRRLHASDQGMICAHFQRLDAATRRSRFCATLSDAGVLDYAGKIFRHDSILCGAIANGHLRGLAELRGARGFWPLTTEAAFSVEADWQDMGIGDALFDRVFAIAQNRGVRTIQMMCLKENSRMKHLAIKHHAALSYDTDSVEAVLHPYWPTPASMARELVGETKGHAKSYFA